MTQKHTLPETGYLRLPEVLKLIPVSRSHWWQGVKDGIFPAPTKLSPRVTVWHVADILGYIERTSPQSKI